MGAVDATNSGAVASAVRRQYERYPYPDNGPADAPATLTLSGFLDDVCHLIWHGAKDPNALRVLDAGCGAGATTCQAALRCPGARVVGIDMSETSIALARRRAEATGAGAEHHVLPIDRVGELGETFDLVLCIGVLHHMPDPVVGLRALREALDPQGAVSAMVYAPYGRDDVYRTQEALRLIRGDADVSGFIGLARSLYAHAQSPDLTGVTDRLDLREGNDSGIVDLLLHAHDAPMSVGEVYALLDASDMALHSWAMPLEYDPAHYVEDESVLEALARAPERERQAIAELLHGAMRKHSFVAVRPEFATPHPSLEGARWREYRALLTNRLFWNRMRRSPDGREGLVEAAGSLRPEAAMRLVEWQGLFIEAVSRDRGARKLGAIADTGPFRAAMPRVSRKEQDALIARLLRDLVARDGIAVLNS